MFGVWDLSRPGPVQRVWGPSSGTPEELRAFLARPVPPGSTPAFEQWQREAKTFGSFAPTILIEVLTGGGAEEQNSALLTLRLYGFEIWGFRRGDFWAYRLRHPDSTASETIVPSNPIRIDP